jgi:hypothetical protein
MLEIQTLGKHLLYFLIKFSHAVNKKPADGDFRIQVQFGGKYSLIHPDAALIAKAQKIVDSLSDNLLYAR